VFGGRGFTPGADGVRPSNLEIQTWKQGRMSHDAVQVSAGPCCPTNLRTPARSEVGCGHLKKATLGVVWVK
jgi:hypothetical protein